jgi:hypothetical protein
LQVLQEWLAQDEQEWPEDLIRLAPPPTPKVENNLRTGPPQVSQRTAASWPRRTRTSNFFRQFSQQNS